MPIIPISKEKAKAKSKSVEPNQKSVDALPLGSGTWRVEDVPGLYLRCRARTKSFELQRRIDGTLVKETLGELPIKRAKELAMKRWSTVRAKPAKDGFVTLGIAIEQYLEADHRGGGQLADKTKKIARYNANRYLVKWKDRSLGEIGKDRLGIRSLQQRITKDHGKATANQVMRLLAATYRWHQDVDDKNELPDWPRKVAQIHKIKPRDWAYAPEELKLWWYAGEKKGVSTLSTVKRTWWTTTLLTGARKGSIEALKWSDIDLDTKVIHFAVAKGGRTYRIPMADLLASILKKYRDSEDVVPSQWVFPSPTIDNAHMVDVKNVREGVGPAHRLRHTFRTVLAEIGASPDQARLLLGHSMGNDVSRGYITAPLLIESLRPVTNAAAKRYLEIIGPM